MNISRNEQRVLHVLAGGGAIRHRREDSRIADVALRDARGAYVGGLHARRLRRLRRKRLIESNGGALYHISRLGRLSVRAQLDNRA